MTATPREINLCFLCFRGMGHIIPAYKFVQRLRNLIEEEKFRICKRCELGDSVYHPQGIVRTTLFCQINDNELQRFKQHLRPADDIEIVVRLVESDQSTTAGGDAGSASDNSGDGTAKLQNGTTDSSRANKENEVLTNTFGLFNDESASGAWAERVVQYYKAGWNTVSLSPEGDSYSATLAHETGIHYEHMTTRNGLTGGAPFAQAPDCIIADMFISFDGDVAAKFGNCPCWAFHPSNLVMAGYDYRRRVMEFEEICRFEPSDVWLKTPDHHTNVAEVSRRPHRKGIIINDVEDWYDYNIVETVAHNNCTGPEAWQSKSARKTRPWEVLCVGPLLLADLQPPAIASHVQRWLDDLRTNDRNFIFITMGSQFNLSKEMHDSLVELIEFSLREARNTCFLWADRSVSETKLTKDKRLLIEPWVDQVGILQSDLLVGVITHAGWNGLLETMTLTRAEVLCMPLGAEQGINARCVQRFYKNGSILKHINETKISKEVFAQSLIKDRLTWEAPSHEDQTDFKVLAHRAFKNSSKRNAYRFLQSLI